MMVAATPAAMGVEKDEPLLLYNSLLDEER